MILTEKEYKEIWDDHFNEPMIDLKDDVIEVFYYIIQENGDISIDVKNACFGLKKMIAFLEIINLHMNS